MFRMNRGRAIGILLTGFIIYFLFLASSDSGDFRKRTEEGLSRKHSRLQGDLTDEAFRAQTNEKLNDILAKQEERLGQRPLRVSDEGSGPAAKVAGDDEITGVAGRKTMQRPNKEKPKYPVGDKQENLKEPAEKEVTDTKPAAPSDPGKDYAREVLQDYLKKPLVIFSKSYCPHSKRAKHLLLDLYKIVPTPLVVELDQLTERVPQPAKAAAAPAAADGEEEYEPPAPTLGQKVQELLAEISGRRTVPNIMLGGTTSIGGNDIIWEMHAEGTLADKIKELGGKRITSVELVEGAEGAMRRRRR